MQLLQLRRLLSTSNTTSTLLSWPDFFKTRQRLVWLKRLGGGVPAVSMFLVGEGALLSMPVFDPTQPIFGLDPLVVVALGTFTGLAGSYFAGSAAAGWAFRLLKPRLAEALNARQRDFYTRITRYRANVPPNPTQMNFSFDFYGEKIRSVQDYRTWLRRQKKMLKERQFAL